MSSSVAIHQFTPSVAVGDGVTGGVLLTQSLLHELGFVSRIYARQIDPLLAENVESLDDFNPSPEDILLYHYSIGHRDHEWLMALPQRKIIVYHNITPAHFFTATPHLSAACAWGREQLADSPSYFCAAYADSAYNARELSHLGYPSPQVIPLLIDTALPLPLCDFSLLPPLGEKYVILFVGRIVTNKCQHQLVDILYALKNKKVSDIVLILAGGVSDSGYDEFLHHHISYLGMDDEVIITGKISDAYLDALYSRADLYLSMSLHEGFGIPMVEAMRYDIPVLAYDTTAVGENLPTQGRLSCRNPVDVADKIIDVMENSSVRTALVRQQRENIRRFERPRLLEDLSALLISVGIYPPSLPSKTHPCKDESIRIDGPCDSTYSLALVNRELGRSLLEQGGALSFFATEGPGNYPPDRGFLANDPQILTNLHPHPIHAYTVIRNLYPPRVSSMGGALKLLGPYGWEESSFPHEQVQNFNRRLSGIACMSTYVAKVMRDNGVTVPLCVTGIGADHILKSPPQPLDFDLPEGIKLLHVSSCFPRKGVDVLIAALGHLQTPLTLIVKTFPNPHNTLRADLIRDGYIPISSDHYAKGDKTVLVIEKELSMGQMRTLYSVCDCLAAPSRGEGFGLPMAEAMLLNLPVVTTAYGGQSDFCTPDTAWLVDYTFAAADTHMGLFDSVWANPDTYSLAAQIEAVLDTSTQERHHRTDAARTRIASRFTWEAVASRMEDFVQTLKTPPPQTRDTQKKIAWITTYNTKCGIAEYSRHLIRPMRNTPMVFAPYGQPLTPDEPYVLRCWSSDDLSALSSAIEQYGIETLLLQFNYSLIDFHLLRRFLEHHLDAGRKIFVTLHSTIDAHPQEKKLSLLVDVFQRCHLLVHTLPDLNRLREYGLIHNVTVFPHGVVDGFLPSAPVALKAAPFTLAAYGFFLPSKGFLELIDAVAVLRFGGIDVSLSLITARYDAPISDALIAQAHERIAHHCLSGYVTLETRFLSDEESLERLSRADLIVFPYRNTGESSSAAVRFGLASHRPVAVTPIPIFDELGSAVHRLQGLCSEDMAQSLSVLIAQIQMSDPSIIHTSDIAREWCRSHAYSQLSHRLEALLKI